MSGLGGAALICAGLGFWWLRTKRKEPRTASTRDQNPPMTPLEDVKRFAPVTPPPVQSERQVPYWMAVTPEQHSNLRYPDESRHEGFLKD
jgi:hypothetical protein